jgi:pimeloyl-ACP methyl ester carboxylesterase
MSTNPQDGSRPTVVLVHGAFADGSSWNEVIKRLQAEGLQVTAPANPLRGISIDSAYIGSLLEQIPGPVLAVAHSYGGAVITNAATNANNVLGLVYVAAFAPDEGEPLGAIASNSKDSVVFPTLIPLQYPTGEGQQTATEFTIDPERFHEIFAFDLSAEQSALMAATQRPSPSRCSRSLQEFRPGRRCHLGRWSLAATKWWAPMPSVRWPSAPGLRSPRPRAPT